MDFGALDLLILDVDGVLTAGQVFQDSRDDSARAFYVRDGCLIKRWHDSGGQTALLSGRQSVAVDRRARDLGISEIVQGAGEKLEAYDRVLQRFSAEDANVCYMGDDLPDVGPMRRSGFPVAVANAAGPVKRIARYVTVNSGGGGAVAETIELILRKKGHWNGGL
jgi:3-deoxy-D-manno-octulosonate 8-phosphate phosphatase (KDO 8-P phosphatase)